MQTEYGQAVSYAAGTDVGRTREGNEDSYCVNAELGLYVVADGMGGHDSGEVASQIAVDTIEQQVAQGADLALAIERAHQAIIDGVKQGIGKHGMGTTVVAIQVFEDQYTLAWVGDSRAYLWDQGLVQLSRDHSLVQMLLDSGQITEAEARVHPRKNIIYQNLGAEDINDFQVSVKKGNLYKDQKLILCSDGLSDELDDEAISDIVGRGVGRVAARSGAEEKTSDNSEIVDELIAAALENGGNDNVSLIVISASDSAPDRPELTTTQAGIDKDTLVPDN